MPNIIWFWLFKCEELLIFFIRLNILGVWIVSWIIPAVWRILGIFHYLLAFHRLNELKMIELAVEFKSVKIYILKAIYEELISDLKLYC